MQYVHCWNVLNIHIVHFYFKDTDLGTKGQYSAVCKHPTIIIKILLVIFNKKYYSTGFFFFLKTCTLM